MLDETLLLAAIVRERKAYEAAIRIGLVPGELSDAGAFFLQAARKQYTLDPGLQACDVDVLKAQIQRRYGDGSIARSMLDFLATFPADVSGVNVVEEYRLLRLDATATALATALASGRHGEEETQALIARYDRLQAGLPETDEKLRLDADDFTETTLVRIPLWPSNLNDFVGGGVLRGHNITVYGRPDSGKSLWALNQAASAVRQGYRVLYVANEEPAQDITRRILSRLANVPISKLQTAPAIRKALDHVAEAYERWNLFHKAGATMRDVARVAVKVKPDLIIVDQLKNIAVDDDNRALQLDKLARQVRELGIASNAVTISVTQAGESAQGKITLGMGDIEWSNTGIPGAADLLIGIGVNDEFERLNKRMLSMPKNKINGKHGAIPVWVDPSKTAFLTTPRKRQ